MFSFEYLISFQEHKSVKEVREQSILAVHIAKFGPLKEPIKMLIFAMDQFSHNIITDINALIRNDHMFIKLHDCLGYTNHFR